MRASAHRPPPALGTLLNLLDPGEGKTVIVAPDLLADHPEIDQTQLDQCRQFLDQLLKDAATSNADLKGMLNRLAGPAWGMPFEFGGDAKAARRLLEAVRAALR